MELGIDLSCPSYHACTYWYAGPLISNKSQASPAAPEPEAAPHTGTQNAHVPFGMRRGARGVRSESNARRAHGSLRRGVKAMREEYKKLQGDPMVAALTASMHVALGHPDKFRP